MVATDSDWAGCRETRRSTSGFVVQWGEHIICFGSKTHKTIALSSGEAELTAQVSGIVEALGMRNLLAEMGIGVPILSRCDSSAARGVLQRTGVGQLRHLEVKHLWVQDLVATKTVNVEWIPRAMNAADFLTHGCSRSEFHRRLAILKVIVHKLVDQVQFVGLRRGVGCMSALLHSHPLCEKQSSMQTCCSHLVLYGLLHLCQKEVSCPHLALLC